MFNNWRVVIFTRNMSDGEAEETIRKATEKEARDIYLNKLSSFGTNPQTKCMTIKLYNTEGQQVEEYYVNNAQYIEAPTEV